MWGGTVVFLVVLFLVAISVRLQYLIHEPILLNVPNLSFHNGIIGLVVIDIVWFLACCVIALIIAYKRPYESGQLFLSVGLILYGLVVSPSTSPSIFILPEISIAFHPIVTFIQALACVTTIVWMYLFPDGKFVLPWTKSSAILWSIIILCLLPWMPLTNPRNQPPLPLWFVFLFLVPFSTGLYAQIYRYRYTANAVQRQQTKWVVFGTGTSFIGFFSSLLLFQLIPLSQISGSLRQLIGLVAPIVFMLTMLFSISTIGISIVQYRLWDIDTVINRTVVYGVLAGIIVGVYVLLVSGVGQLVQARGSWGVSLVAAGVVAVLFQPLRAGLQRRVNRWMFGDRDDPPAALHKLGLRLERAGNPTDVLTAVVSTTAQALRLPYTAIILAEEGEDETGYVPQAEPVVSYGQSKGLGEARFPLTYQSEVVGWLVVSSRAPGETLGRRDRRLLETMARQAGAAVRAACLTQDLQQSRQRIVQAREAERQRLRRDLHDGLGPLLAGQGLKLAAVRRLVQPHSARADGIIAGVLEENAQTVATVRELVYGLRPPVLDERGLVAAVQDYVLEAYGQVDWVEGLRVVVHKPVEPLPPLTAAVDVAAYRIALEGVTNVTRHAQATLCEVWFMVEGGCLVVLVTDNGVGLPIPYRAGTGVISMRERAEELGGTLMLARGKVGGTVVRGVIPL